MVEASVRSGHGRAPRVEPSVPVATAVFVAYVIAFIGVTSTSGVAFDEWFATADNAYRTAVYGLAAGAVVLIAFLVWARWDFVWRDPERLPMTPALKAVVALHVVGILISFGTRDWDAAAELVVPIVLAGILVGFCEEMLFRGIILRSLRTDYRSEYSVLWITSLWFGLFHLTNILNGATAFGVTTQVLNASIAGAVLYTVRRYRGMLVLGMVLHGLWDIGVFFPVSEDLMVVGGLTPYVGAILPGIIALVVLRRDRDKTVTPRGLVEIPDRVSSTA